MDSLHTALKTQVIRTVVSQTTRFTQVRLQHGKDRFTETLHAQPSSFTTAGFQLTDFIGLLGFQRSPCPFLGSECYVRQIRADFETQGFADLFHTAYERLTEGARQLEACGIFVPCPEGWGFFGGVPSESRHREIHRGSGDGHTGAKSERMKAKEDQYFRFVFSWLDGPHFKGWVTHYRPQHVPLAPEFDAALNFLGGFRSCNECPEFDFDWCQWRGMPYAEAEQVFPYQGAEIAHAHFNTHEKNFSPGIEKLLAAHAMLAPFGITFLKIAETHEPALAVRAAAPTGSPPLAKAKQGFKYDVAISFAGTERSRAEAVANILRAAGLRVFYDNYYPEQLWGKDLAAEFDRIYRKESRFCLMFVSEEYAKRIWTTHERRSALARLVQENGKEYILPVRVDSTDLDGLPPTIGYLTLSNHSIEDIGKLLITKVKS
jgi:hypothetical protein